MRNSRSLLTAFAAAAAVAATAGVAAAAGPPCNGPFCNQSAYPKYYSVGGYLLSHFNHGGKQPPMPAFQAAPWYLYWPYDGHFMTPAPVTGAFYGPPTPGNFPVNPYFPGPAYGYGGGGGGGYGPPGYPGGPYPRP